MLLISAGWLLDFDYGVLGVMRWLEKPPDPSAVQAKEPKTRVVPSGTLLASLDPAIEFADELAESLPGAPVVGVYRQACSGILLAVRFVRRDRLLWNSMVQGTQRFRQISGRELRNTLRHVWLFVLP